MANLSKAGMEGILMALSLGSFLLYNIWLMFLRGRLERLRRRRHDCHHKDFYAQGKLGRAIFSGICASDPKEAILAVQQARNAMTASTYLATVSSILATAGITVLLDRGKLDQVTAFQLRDPILRHFDGAPLSSPQAVLMSALVVLYTSFMFFAQSVRLYVHFGFYARCASDGGARGGKGQVSADDVRLVAVRAGMAFTVGMRLFFLFIVLVLWSGGVTYMAVAAVIITAFLAYFDMFDALDENAPADVAAERDATLERISLLERGEAMRGGGGDAAKAAPPPAAAATPSQIALASQD